MAPDLTLVPLSTDTRKMGRMSRGKEVLLSSVQCLDDVLAAIVILTHEIEVRTVNGKFSRSGRKSLVRVLIEKGTVNVILS